MEFLKIISFGGAAIGLLLSLHLAVNKRGLPIRLLASYLFCVAMFLLEPVAGSGFLKSVLTVVLACVSFVIGPVLFLYTRFRFDPKGWKVIYWIHFLPAAVILLLMLMSLPVQPVSKKSSTDELVLYGLFVTQLFGYTGAALVCVLRHARNTNSEIAARMHISFTRSLVYASIGLFSFSVFSTLLALNKSSLFANIIQLLLNAIIFIVAFLNADALESHKEVHAHREL
jgi:hypothetical protein